MKRFLIKILIILLFFICFFNINSFGFSDFDYSELFNKAEEYLFDNNYTYYDYVIADDGEYINLVFLINENYNFYLYNFNNDIYDACNYYVIFTYDNSLNLVNNEPFINTSSVCYAHFPISAVVYSSFDILNNDNSIYFEKKELDKVNFSINLSTTENTSKPIKVYSNYFSMDDLHKYKIYISEDLEKWELMDYSTLTNAETGVTEFRFNYTIYKNGVYYFKLLDLEKNKEYYKTFNIFNIGYEGNYGYDGIPIAHVNYYKNGEIFSMRTQNFNNDCLTKYKCFYTTDPLLDYSEWSKMDIGSIDNKQLNIMEYYYFFQTSIYNEDCTYYFVFYDIEKEEYGTISSLTCIFDKMIEYSEKVSGVVEEKKSKLDELLDFFKDRFGFLTFPFEFIADFLNRILSIEYKEPIIRIPELYIPGTDELIFPGYEYNFNSLLENEVFLYIHNIYFIAVDFIIIIGVIILAKNTLMEVFSNG